MHTAEKKIITTKEGYKNKKNKTKKTCCYNKIGDNTAFLKNLECFFAEINQEPALSMLQCIGVILTHTQKLKSLHITTGPVS